MKIDVVKLMPNMVKVAGVGYDIATNTIQNSFWSGWLQVDNIEVLEAL